MKTVRPSDLTRNVDVDDVAVDIHMRVFFLLWASPSHDAYCVGSCPMALNVYRRECLLLRSDVDHGSAQRLNAGGIETTRAVRIIIALRELEAVSDQSSCKGLAIAQTMNHAAVIVG